MPDTPSSTSSSSSASKTTAKAGDEPARDAGGRHVDESGNVLSTQAHFSTYTENTDVPDNNPPDGPHVLQELGQPSEGPVPEPQGPVK
jgi:hypothetical protein